MCSALDSVLQAHLVPDDLPPAHWSPCRVSAEGLAAVRAPLLLADRLVATANQLFDGRALLALGPDGFAQVSGFCRRDLLELLPRRVGVPEQLAAPSLPPRLRLEASLASLMRYPGAEPGTKLRRFRWSLLPATAGSSPSRGQVAERLPGLSGERFVTRCDEIGTAAAVAWTLEAVGVPGEQAAALQRRWEAWLDAADQLEVIAMTHDGIRRADLTPRLMLRGAAAAARTTRATDRLLAELRAAFQTDRPDELLEPNGLAIRSRSGAYDWIDEHAMGLTTDARSCLHRWVDLVSLRSQARQAGAVVLDLEVVDTDVDTENDLALVDHDAIAGRIDRRFLAGIRRMPPELFSTMRHRLRDAAATVGPGADQRAQRRAARTVARMLSEELAQPEPARRYRITALKVALTLVATTLLLVDIPLVVALALMLVVVTLLPELEVLLTLRPGRMQRRFDLRPRG